jgi:hypothetical protein
MHATGSDKSLRPILDQFIMPYDKNEQFIGRHGLLHTLRTMLCEVVAKQYNHRVALNGLGGIGKTQTAIAYVYAYRDEYEKIYWINAENEASLLSGFQEIATRTHWANWAAISEPASVAKSVLAWLRQPEQNNWLW